MDGSEQPYGDEATFGVYRLSWVPYAKTVLAFIVIVVLVTIVSVSVWNSVSTEHDRYTVLWLAFAGLVFAVGASVYKVLFLRSVHLYTDDYGVWLFSGILPWRRATWGVKWRDIEAACYYTGFFSWILRSYTVRVGHRFTRTSEIVLDHVARGNQAAEHINNLHQVMLRNEEAGDV
ncbi:hypothetical protein [Pseudomonas oryzihabitans]|uniref:hypothetical protein n=1 Tax=Pseudomonas oryzihabitans TaxID=47885 RepID=UPI00285E5E42|nr:hypothetical protein [Pseudomonas psychrotolerans]MDR6679516.1 hypothetical protein [Pseudomonas psychrotolerans]